MKKKNSALKQSKIETPITQSSKEEIKNEAKEEERFIPKKMEKIMETQPKQTNTQNSTQQKQPQSFSNEEHESRQNIVGDAKIATEKLKTNLQSVHTQLNETVDKLKSSSRNKTEGEKSAVYRKDVFDQSKLTSQGKDIASTFRTNQDPNFSRSNTEEMSAVEKENFQEGGVIDSGNVRSSERVITPHEDRVINTEGEKITSAYPITKELKKGQQVVETKLNENTDLNKGQEKRPTQIKQKEEKKVM
jgi:hypothetical protein